MSFEFIPFLLIVFVVYITAEIVRIRWHDRTGQSLAQCAVPFQALHESPKHRVLVIGDSSAVGTGALNPENSVAGRLSRAYPHTHIENYGRNGMRTAGLLKALRSLPQEKRYDLAILNIGGNDVVFLSALADVEKEIGNVLTEAHARAKKVILWSGGNAANIPAIPFTLRYLYRKRTLLLRTMFTKAAKKFGTIYIDLFREKKDDPCRQKPKLYVAADRFHPSDAGYGLWFDALQKTLSEHSITLA